MDALKAHRRISRAYRSQLVAIGLGVAFVFAAFGLRSAGLTVAAIAAFIYLAASDMMRGRSIPVCTAAFAGPCIPTKG